MTKDDFEKLIETDPERDEILDRVKIGLGESKNDEVWYDICAENYKLCAGNIESFYLGLYRALDKHKIINANIAVLEKNDKDFIDKKKELYFKIKSYIEKHHIEKAKDEKQINAFITDVKDVVFDEYIEPRAILECLRKYLEDVKKLWEVAEKLETGHKLHKIGFSLSLNGCNSSSYKITEEKTINMLKDAIRNKIPWLTPYEYLKDRKLNETKINNDIEKIKKYDQYNFSRLRDHLIYEIFLLLVKYEYVEETNSNEYDINTKNGKCAMLSTKHAVWIYDLIVHLGIHQEKDENDKKFGKDEENKKYMIKDALKQKNARNNIDFPIDTYRRRYSARFTKYFI